jgi:hypothetical protein
VVKKTWLSAVPNVIKLVQNGVEITHPENEKTSTAGWHFSVHKDKDHCWKEEGEGILPVTAPFVG